MVNYLNNEDTKNKFRKKKKRTFSDNRRQLSYNLTTVRANLKFVSRVVLRELKYFIPLQDLFILFLMIGIILVLFLIILLFGIPFSLSFINREFAVEIQLWFFRAIFNEVTIRYGAAIIGVGTVVIRLMIKSPIMKYKDKVNTKKDVTYIFGSSRPAEQFLYEMVHHYGYEEKISLIADADLLWIRKLKSKIDIYVVEDLREFEKPNIYEIIGFQNAERVMILTESIELNQNILTMIRKVRPDVDIILLSQYAPSFVFSELVQDEHLVIIEDLDVTIQGLVTSLSLDFDFPPTAEIDVPRSYINNTGIDMSSDIPKLDVLLIRRGNELLPPEMTLQKGDRIIVHYFSNYNMMLANRVVTELPLEPKAIKSKNDKKIRKNKKLNSNIREIMSSNSNISVIRDDITFDSEIKKSEESENSEVE